MLTYRILGHLHTSVKTSTRLLTSGLCSSTRRSTSNSAVPFPSGSVLVSTCQDVYRNLAFEDWIYDNCHIAREDDYGILLLWRNKPCVVIGRHQNPWAELNVKYADRQKISVARRKSGGGCVYHDLGNLNCTFVTSRSRYDRRQNLEVLAESLVRGWGLDVQITDRDDLTVNNKYKISGTASKLGRQVAYHHCTLLFDVKTTVLGKVLAGPLSSQLSSRATESVRSSVINLLAVDPSVTYDGLINSISRCYQEKFGGSDSVRHVDPTNERTYPGIHQLHQNLRDWNWIYGKTPKFSISKSAGGISQGTEFTVFVEKGSVADVKITGDGETSNHNIHKLIQDRIVGIKLKSEDFEAMLNCVSNAHGLDSDEEKMLLQVMEFIKKLVV